MYVKSQEYEVPSAVAPVNLENRVKIPHKVKIITWINSNLDKLAYVLTLADSRSSWDPLAFKSEQIAPNKLKIQYLKLTEGVFEETVSYEFV